MDWRPLLAVLACFLLVGAALPDAERWRDPVPGTRAFLGDEGGGTDYADVCSSPDEFRRHLAVLTHLPGCPRLPSGLPVTLGRKVADPSPPLDGGERFPLIEIIVPSRHVTGYVQLLGGVHPVIPPNTVLQAANTSGHDEPARLAASPRAALNSGTPLSGRFTIRVLGFDPYSNGRPLRVAVLSGPSKGRTGWMWSKDLATADGDPPDTFRGVLDDPADGEPDTQTAVSGRVTPPHTWHGGSGWALNLIGGGETPKCLLMHEGDGIVVVMRWDDEMALHFAMLDQENAIPNSGQPANQWDYSKSAVSVAVDKTVLLDERVVQNPMPDHEGVFAMPEVLMAWAHNNAEDEARHRPDAAAVFDLLRHGHELVIRTWDKTYHVPLGGLLTLLPMLGECSAAANDLPK